MMKNFLAKLTSRKFLASLTIIITGLITMFTGVPVEQAEKAADGVVQVSPYAQYIPQAIGALMAIIGALGYLKAESTVDASKTESKSDTSTSSVVKTPVAPHEGAKL